MKVYAVLLCIGLSITLSSCGESKEDIKSREEISSLIRQLNVLADDFSFELEGSSLNTQTAIDSYFAKLDSPLKERRMKFATVELSDKFTLSRTLIDKTISSWVYVHDTRKEMREVLLPYFEEHGVFEPYLSFEIDSSAYELKLLVCTLVMKGLHKGADSLNRVLRGLSISDTLALTFADSSRWHYEGRNRLEDVDFIIIKERSKYFPDLYHRKWK